MKMIARTNTRTSAITGGITQERGAQRADHAGAGDRTGKGPNAAHHDGDEALDEKADAEIGEQSRTPARSARRRGRRSAAPKAKVMLVARAWWTAAVCTTPRLRLRRHAPGAEFSLGAPLRRSLPHRWRNGAAFLNVNQSHSPGSHRRKRIPLHHVAHVPSRSRRRAAASRAPDRRRLPRSSALEHEGQHRDSGRLRKARRIEALPHRTCPAHARRRARNYARGGGTLHARAHRQHFAAAAPSCPPRARVAPPAILDPRSTSTMRSVVEIERRHDVEADATVMHLVVDQHLMARDRMRRWPESAGMRAALQSSTPAGSATGAVSLAACWMRASAALSSRAFAGVASCRR